MAGLLWGSSFTVVKLGLRSLDPFWFVFFRFAVASAVALVMCAATGRIGRVAKLLRDPLVIWLGVSNAAGFVLQFNGQTMTSAANAALLINVSTMFVAIGSRFVFREQFGLPKLLAVVAGMVGVFLVTTGGRPLADAGPSLTGDLLVISAAFLWTFFILLNKRIVAYRDLDIQALTTAMVVITAVTALPAAVVFAGDSLPSWSGGLWTVLYTAIFCTVLPFYLWTWGLKHITATTSCIILLAEVVFALGLAAVVLGDRLTPVALAGSVLILGAVALVSREKAPEIPVGPDLAPECCGAVRSKGERDA